jgi:hypothetical protein
MMSYKVIVSRQLPTPDALQALSEALKTALTTRYEGVQAGPGWICALLADTATADDQNTARQIILNHDFNARTADQQEAAAIAVDGEDVIARYLASPMAAKTPAQIYTLVQGEIDAWATLADAKADLRVWLPLMAAGVQLALRRYAREG